MSGQAHLFESNEPILAEEQAWRVDKCDAVEWLSGLPSESVDLIVTDPAYESLEKHRRVGTTTRLKKAWFPIFPNARFAELFAELYRVLKQDTHCYIICDHETMFHIKPLGEAAGFTFWKPLIWDKQKMGMGYHYRSSYEVILFFEKGKRALNNNGTRDVISVPKVFNGYPTEKPVELLRTLIRMSSGAGELVVDPFVGSGSCGEAALSCERVFAGCDLTEEGYQAASERLREFYGA